MKRMLLFLFCVLFQYCGLAQEARMDEILQQFHFESQQKLIAAHRGGHLHSPENSLSAIDEAILAGAVIAEIDIRATKDGVMVLSHDKTLDRATTGTGLLQDYNYAELSRFFLKHNDTATIYHIPTFREVLAYAKGKIMLDIDFKIDGIEARKKAYEIIKELGMEKQVIFFIYDYTELATLRQLNPNITVMPRAYNEDQLRNILNLNLTNIIHIDPSFVNSPLLEEVQKKDIRLWINTLGQVDAEGSKDAAAYQAFFNKFRVASVFQTDYPELLNQLVKKNR